MNRVLRILLIAAVLSGGALGLAQEGAKQDMKDAGHDSKNAAKHTGRAVKKTAKKGTHKSARKVRKGAGSVEEKTGP